MNSTDEVIIIGAGIGGLTLALSLHAAGIGCRIYEAVPEFKPIGVGINLLPHATKELAALGLEEALAAVAVTTADATFFNRFGQLIYREPLGRNAGLAWPQFSIHRADLHAVLLDACVARIGSERIRTAWRCVGFEQDEHSVRVNFKHSVSGEDLPPQGGCAVLGCDGINSAIRKQLYPREGPPIYSGVNMWRGVTAWAPFLSHASMTRAGWHAHGKMVIYPIRNNIDALGRQLINWVAEVETANYRRRDWNRPGNIEDFIGYFADWRFQWLDVPALIRASEVVLEFPMVDQDPLPRWSFGRASLLGDAAHPMYPRGSNGGGQAILDARTLAHCLTQERDPLVALQRYEALRLETTARIVRMNRANPPDAILREVYLRTGDKPFARIEDVISADELQALSDGYKRVSGSDNKALQGTEAR
jgi:2-polyprenyl-6-methoxyphenol hydroxylase-like FAD-dependent oxidoreductase